MTVFSGMLFATMLGVCLVPALYVLVERLTGSKASKPAVQTADTGGHP